LLALDDIEYPFDAKKERVTGTVTMTGTIDSQGIMTGVTMTESNITPIERKILLENAALENLKTWRFEKSQHQDPFQITYTYSIDAPKGHEGMTEVQPALPDHVYIRLNPWKP
jgi:TonB family protein